MNLDGLWGSIAEADTDWCMFFRAGLCEADGIGLEKPFKTSFGFIFGWMVASSE